MNYNAKNSLLLQLLKLFGAYIVSQLLIVFIFAAAVSGDEIPEKYDLPMVIIAILLAFAVNMVIDFNAIARLKSTIAKSKSDITAVTETGAALIDKAEPKPRCIRNLPKPAAASAYATEMTSKRLWRHTPSLNQTSIPKSF